MKKISFSILLLFMAGCNGPKELSRTVIVTGLDFRPYTEKGFLITPEKYANEYQSIGIIKIQIIPAVKKNDYTVGIDLKVWSPVGSYQSGWLVERLDTKLVIDEAYKTAIAMGADAISQFNITSREFLDGDILIPTYEATGFAIKRVK